MMPPEKLVFVEFWLPAVLLSLFLSTIQSLRYLMAASQKSSHLFAWANLLLLTIGIGLQGLSGISIIGSLGMSLIALSWCLLLLGYLMNFRLKTSLIPVLIYPLSAFFIVLGWRFGEARAISETDHLERLHIFLTLLGLTLTLLACVISVIFFLQDLKLKRQLKTRVSLPSLDLMSKLIQTFDGFSLLFLTAAIGSGAWYAKEIYGEGWSQQMPWIFIFTLLTWSFLALIVFTSWKKWLPGKYLALSNVLLFALVLLTLFKGHYG